MYFAESSEIENLKGGASRSFLGGLKSIWFIIDIMFSSGTCNGSTLVIEGGNKFCNVGFSALGRMFNDLPMISLFRSFSASKRALLRFSASFLAVEFSEMPGVGSRNLEGGTY